MKIAHISDLHLHKISYGFSQFFSKRWIGNLNLILFRKNRFCSKQVFILPDLFEKLGVDYVIVTGDISSTSLDKEFEEAKKLFSDDLKKRGINSFFLPGNHDSYTKKAYKQKTFYKYFETKQGSNPLEQQFTLKKDGIEAVKLQENWWYVGLDCSLATHLISSRGLFSQETEESLKSLLSKIPKNDSIILANHFPFKLNKSPRKALKRAGALKAILKENPNIKVFLHGHTHHHKIYDMRKKGLPLVLDSGTAAHNKSGKWNLLNIKGSSCEITVYEWIGKWNKTEDQKYTL